MNDDTKETSKPWEEDFYESGWEPDTLTLTDAEQEWMTEVTSFLPRHMAPYDWNLPFAEMILLITRRRLSAALEQERAVVAILTAANASSKSTQEWMALEVDLKNTSRDYSELRESYDKLFDEVKQVLERYAPGRGVQRFCVDL